MKNKKITTLLLCLCSIIVQAQQQEVISSSGSYMENSSGSIAMTIGECVTKTHVTTNIILTQGFHQTNLISTVIKELEELDFEIMAYPNPVMTNVILKVEKPQGLYYILYDMNGQILEQKKIKNIETEIDFGNLAPSDYIIKIINNDYEVKSFKIVKN